MSPILLGREIREQFPGTKDKTFLDAACVSLAPLAATEAIKEFLDLALSCPAESSSAHHLKMDEMRRACGLEAARLFRVDPEEIALVESTTHGLNIAATSFALPPASTVLIPDLEFLQVAIPWACQRDRGVRLKAVPNRSGRVTVEDFAAAWDSTVRAVVTSSVEWSNGYRLDLEGLGKLCRERGALFIVDAIQQVGAVDIDLRGSNVDIMVAGGHKWLNAPFGTGVLYVRRELLDTPTVFHGYLNLTTPEGGWPLYFGTPDISPIRDYQFTRTAQRFEIGGTANYPGAVGLAASLRLVNGIGIDRVTAHVLDLTDYALEALSAAGAVPITVPERSARSGIVTFRFYSDLEEERRLLDFLHEHRVYVAMRFTSGVGGIRVSCHYYNQPEDIDRLVEVLGLAARRKAPDYGRGQAVVAGSRQHRADARRREGDSR